MTSEMIWRQEQPAGGYGHDRLAMLEQVEVTMGDGGTKSEKVVKKLTFCCSCFQSAGKPMDLMMKSHEDPSTAVEKRRKSLSDQLGEEVFSEVLSGALRRRTAGFGK